MSTKPAQPEHKPLRLEPSEPAGEVRRVAMLSTFLPRPCGIATYASDLCDAMLSEYPELQCFVLAMNDQPRGYQYPERVRFELQEDDPASYQRAADFLELSDLDLLCVQHEFGIFGGPGGGYVLELLRRLRMPIVTTLHTVYEEPPEPVYSEVFQELVQLSDRLVVISRCAGELVHRLYGVPRAKIDIIPHGIHDVPFIDPNFYKDKFQVEGRHVLLTFGLLGPNKGIEYVIRALPQIVARHPDVVYIVLGATHPYWLRREGEAYRESLQRLARELGVESHVRFHNQFVGLDELLEYIGAADIYITPYLHRQQVSSGTLAYALGSGKAVISTPYWYAEELLANERGVLVPFENAEATARAINALLNEPARLHALRKRAYLYGREMIWAKAARQYMRTFARAREERMRQPRALASAAAGSRRPAALPELKLDHVKRLTDSTGIVRAAAFTVPNHSQGYTTDDNARALVLTAQLSGSDQTHVSQQTLELARTYLAFLWYAFNPATGRFRNHLGYDRRWLEETGSEDCHGRALWALGSVAGRLDDPNLRGAATQLFSEALPAAFNLTSPRSWAYCLLGINEYLRRFYGDHHAQRARQELARRLLEMYRQNSTADWPWFEPEVTYCNARLAHALIVSGRWIPSDEMVDVGLRALTWLAEIQCGEEGCFSPIGDQGYYRRNGERAWFNQQPIEAEAMVSACLAAYRVTGKPHWRDEARRAFEWFLGRNDVRLPLHDPASGGCRDALYPDRTSNNQGAEATLAFLLALAELRAEERRQGPEERSWTPVAGNADRLPTTSSVTTGESK